VKTASESEYASVRICRVCFHIEIDGNSIHLISEYNEQYLPLGLSRKSPLSTQAPTIYAIQYSSIISINGNPAF